MKAQSYPKFLVTNGDTINMINVNGKKQGYWRVFAEEKKTPGYSPDQIIEQGHYDNNLQQGVWEHLDTDGKVDFTFYYIDGIDTNTARKNVLAKNLQLKELLKEVSLLKDELLLLKQTKASYTDNIRALELKLVDQNNSKNTLLIILGLLCLMILIMVFVRTKKPSTTKSNNKQED